MGNDNNAKEGAYSSALYNAWFTTRLEHDKSILALSTSAVGLLSTLLMTVQGISRFQLYLFCTALVTFGLAALLAIHIFEKNSDLLTAIAKELDTEKHSKRLDFLDCVKKYSFYIGVLITIIIGITFGINKI